MINKQIAALYIRVSTDMQTELSPDAQKRELIKYAKNNNYAINEDYIFYDEGTTGRKTKKRTGFNTMIAHAKAGHFQAILVHKFSRFARSQEDSIVYKNLLKKQCSVNVISISEPVIDGPYGELIERIIEWMDEFYSINLAGEVMKGMTQKALNGGYQARPPLGYKIAERHKPPVVVPEEAEIIKMIFEKYVHEKLSPYQIAKHLNTLGLKTSHNKNFERRSIEYILENPTYIGMIRWNRTHNESNTIKDKSEWIISKGEHPAIISEELFNAAQKLKRTTYTPRTVPPSVKNTHFLSGMLKCPECGRTMSLSTVSKKGKKYYYFQCYGYSKGKCFYAPMVSALKIEPYILESLKNTTSQTNLSFKLKIPAPPSTDELSLLKSHLKKTEEKQKRIKTAFINGIDTLEEYKQNKQIVAEELQNVKESISEFQKAASTESLNTTMHNNISSAYDICSDPETYSTEERNTTLRNVVEKIIYYREQDLLKIYYHLLI